MLKLQRKTEGWMRSCFLGPQYCSSSFLLSQHWFISWRRLYPRHFLKAAFFEDAEQGSEKGLCASWCFCPDTAWRRWARRDQLMLTFSFPKSLSTLKLLPALPLWDSAPPFCEKPQKICHHFGSPLAPQPGCKGRLSAAWLAMAG